MENKLVKYQEEKKSKKLDAPENRRLGQGKL